jgi:hypothetical protein
MKCRFPITAALLAALLMTASAPAQLCGDCNANGTVDIVDALAGAQHSVGAMTLTGQRFTNCDVNSSGAVDIVDALFIAQASTGLAVSLNCGGSVPVMGSCSMPIVLTSGVPVAGSTVGGGDDSYPSCSIFSTAEDTTYTITFTGTRTLTVSVTNPSFGATVYVQTSCGVEATELDCDDTANPNLTLPGLSGGTYYIFVDGIGSTEGTYTIVATAI